MNKTSTMDDSQSCKEESDESMDSSSDSEEEGLIPLERPMFLKRPLPQQADNESADRSIKRRHIQVQAVERATQLLRAQEYAQQVIGTNYASEQNLLRRALDLNDDDCADPELERQLWIQRQEARTLIHRKKLLAKQLEIEAYELSRQQMGN